MWIESHVTLRAHPKRLHLQSLTGWSTNETLGVLHSLWWWALQYAEDGDLSKYPPEMVAIAVEANLPNKGDFFKVLIESRWLDSDLKVRSWIDYVGKYLRGKYHTANPERLRQIWAKYGLEYKGKDREDRAVVTGKRRGSLRRVSEAPQQQAKEAQSDKQGRLEQAATTKTGGLAAFTGKYAGVEQ